MTLLWPKLPKPVAVQELEAIRKGGPTEPRFHHADQIYTPVGGGRANEATAETMAYEVHNVATEFGYPEKAADGDRVAFDRAATWVVRQLIDLSWSEAGQREVWHWIALVALPDVTHWRFGVRNTERWIATDLTRHTWARLWWQAVVFEGDPAVLDLLTESDLNQLLERRTMGGDPRLVCALARSIVDRSPDGVNRRPLIREVTSRLLRRLAFIDVQSLNAEDLAELCRNEAELSWRMLAQDGFSAHAGSLDTLLTRESLDS